MNNPRYFNFVAVLGGFLSDTVSHGTMRLLVAGLVIGCVLSVALAGQMPNLVMFIVLYGGVQGKVFKYKLPFLAKPLTYFPRDIVWLTEWDWNIE